MNRNTLSQLDVDATTAKRAQYEGFEFTIDAPARVRVANASYGEDADDHSYLVTIEGGMPVTCECPADEYHAGACKHRVAVAIRGPILEAANSDADAEPVPLPDGGAISPPEPPESSTEDSRSSDCSCLRTMDADGLGCFACYRDGFATANPNATED